MELKMPYDTKAERGVLTWALYTPDGLDAALSLLKPAAFFLEPHRLIFSAMAELHEAGLIVSPISVRERLEARRCLDRMDVSEGLNEVVLNTLGIAFGPSAMQIVQRKWFFRKLATVGETLRALGCNESGAMDAVASEAVRAVVDAVDLSWQQGHRPWTDVIAEAVDALERANSTDGTILGMSSGFPSLDKLTLGWRSGQLIVIGARPSIGKTTFATHLARHALDAGEVVCFFSLEMTGSQIAQKMLLADMRTNMLEVMDGGLDADDGLLRERLGAAVQRLGTGKFDIADAAEVTIQRIRTYAIQTFTEYGKPGIIFVDYLQLIEHGGLMGNEGEGRAVVVAQISRALKTLAMDLQCPIVVMSQLNRSSESRAHRRPMMSDLRESGAIEQDADVVMLLDRSRSMEEEEEDGRPGHAVFRVDIAKNREGVTDVVELLYNPRNMCIYDPTDPSLGINRGQQAHNGV